MGKKILVWVLYLLPVLFFIGSYFLITTSGEDIVQGANTELDIVRDAGEAFKNNGRLPDMYAWSVINLFDYQYQFGMDTIFRAIDVVLAVGIFYMMAVVVVGRRLKLELKDALIFCAGFLMVILTPHGRVLYAGFSAIHNYMLIGAITMGFLMPYLLYLQDKKILPFLIWLMLPLGILFGMSSSLTPIAFVLAVILYRILKKKRWPSWAIMGVVGAVIGILISQLLGPGVGNYAANEVYTKTYDYVAIVDLLNNFWGSLIKILWHVVSNFGRVLVPLGVVLGCELWWRKEQKIRTKTLKSKVFIFEVVFVLVHILIAAQLNAPLRILLPAYLVGVVVVLRVLLDNPPKRFVVYLVCSLALVAVIVRMTLAVNYFNKTKVVLDEIQSAQSDVICVEREKISSKTLPFVYLGQEPMLVDWAMPQVVDGKEVSFCE